MATPANPVDLTADGSARDLVFAVETVPADPGIDAVLVVCAPPFGLGPDSAWPGRRRHDRDDDGGLCQRP
ncbi:hypothetical protein [Streptosporangium saharense]|uniref:hypothetical protein n=1 Tax=Streptosporangium saharense TaxID=1706840 RepID=UPI0034379968